MQNIASFPNSAVLLLALGGVSADLDLIARCDSGSWFECGRQVGQQMRDPIRAAIADTENDDLFRYLETSEGKDMYNAMFTANQNAYPAIAEEYEGMAVGAGLAPKQIFVAALSNELASFAAAAGFATPRAKMCTDYHVMAPGVRAWGHNEDEEPQWLNRTFLVEARGPAGFRYTGFTYAPNVVGWAWGFNSHGLAQSVNAIFPLNVTVGVGVNFLARDVLNARSLDDAIHRACTPKLASGMHFNLGSLHEKNRQVMLETSPLGCNVRELSPPPANGPPTIANHTNCYVSEEFSGLDGGCQRFNSSVHRMARISALPPATSVMDVRAVLSDTEDPQYPIHRDDVAPDFCETLNTVVFDAESELVLVWGRIAATSSRALRAYNWSSMDSTTPPAVASSVVHI